MAQVLFEDEVAAQLMDEYFVNRKIDREERLNLNAAYMNTVQTMTERNGCHNGE